MQIKINSDSNLTLNNKRAFKYFNIKSLLISAVLLLLIGCDSMNSVNDTFSGRKVDYEKHSRSIENLEIPPQLLSAEINENLAVPVLADKSDSLASENQINSAQLPLSQQVLPEQKDIELIKTENIRYLLIKGSKEQTWNKMREFWLSRGMLIKRETPSTGILETEWAENRADIPQGFIRNAIGKVLDGLYSAGTRDKYRVRIEDSDTEAYSELYITHYGMKEVLDGSESERAVWVLRPRDPELEAEMLGSMMVYFGVEELKAKSLLAKKAKQREDKATLVRSGDGESLLIVKETFPRAWRRTGSALDRINFIVEDRDRSSGIYYVQYADPLKEETSNSWLSKLNPWSDPGSKDKTKYQINLIDSEDNTLIKVFDGEGIEDKSSTSYRILTLLHEQLK
jgi:outer membrane protein assembly factor BamC